MLSIEAQNTFVRAYVLAGKCDSNGMLVLNGVPLGKEALFTPNIQPRKIDLAVEELLNKGWLSRHIDGAIEVCRWQDEQRSKDAERKRTSRDSHADKPHESHAERHLKRWKNGAEIPRDCPDREYIDPPPVVDKSTPSGGYARPDSQAPAWPEAVIEQARGLQGRPMASWSGPERYIAARLHCLLFANCSVSEVTNRANASKVAAAFASMAQSRSYGDITLDEYVKYAEKVHAERNGERWFNPWLIKGVVEFV